MKFPQIIAPIAISVEFFKKPTVYSIELITIR